jgi:hypothetical protein
MSNVAKGKKGDTWFGGGLGFGRLEGVRVS